MPTMKGDWRLTLSIKEMPMSFAEFFGCYAGWVFFVALFLICVWPKVFKRTDHEARLRKKLDGIRSPPWDPLPRK